MCLDQSLGCNTARAEKSKRIFPSFLADCHVVIQWQRYGFVQPEGPRRLFIFNHHVPPFILPIIIMCSCVSAPAGRLEKPEESVLSDVSPLSSGVDSGQQSPVSPENRKRERGIKKLWGRFVSQRVSVTAHPFFSFFFLFVFSRSETMKRFVPSSGSVAASRAVRPRVTTPSWASSREEASERRRDQDWLDQGTHGEGCTHTPV